MSDRGAQEIFSELFEALASRTTPETKAVAHKMWKFSHGFDTHPSDWRCDGALIKLGLAKEHISQDVLYKDIDYKE